MGHLDWNGDAFLESVESALSTRLETAAGILRDRMVQLTSTPGPPRSKPGQPPHIDKDELHGQMTVRGSGLRWQAGSPVDHAVYMELGTGHSARDVTRTKHYNKPTQIQGVAPRPWAVRSLMETRQQIVETVLEGVASTT